MAVGNGCRRCWPVPSFARLDGRGRPSLRDCGGWVITACGARLSVGRYYSGTHLLGRKNATIGNSGGDSIIYVTLRLGRAITSRESYWENFAKGNLSNAS